MLVSYPLMWIGVWGGWAHAQPDGIAVPISANCCPNHE